MANALLNKREKIKWDNAFQPDLKANVPIYNIVNDVQEVGTLNGQTVYRKLYKIPTTESDASAVLDTWTNNARTLVHVSGSYRYFDTGSSQNMQTFDNKDIYVHVDIPSNVNTLIFKNDTGKTVYSAFLILDYINNVLN